MRARAHQLLDSSLSYQKITGFHLAENVLTLLKEVEDLRAELEELRPCRRTLEEIRADHARHTPLSPYDGVAFGRRCIERVNDALART
ncbi:MAG TPA: hypothetical protein VFH37_03280 [Candidatus Saccharimonadales bacterium]|nr:hypothetical protein [Candidatus Saccharimonadales bacterium]